MSFNSPASTPDQNEFDYTAVPAYGDTPDVEPTGVTSTFSIVSFVVAILLPILGIVLSIVAWKQAAETGDNKALPKAGIIVGSVLTVVGLIGIIFFYGLLFSTTISGA